MELIIVIVAIIFSGNFLGFPSERTVVRERAECVIEVQPYVAGFVINCQHQDIKDCLQVAENIYCDRSPQSIKQAKECRFCEWEDVERRKIAPVR